MHEKFTLHLALIVVNRKKGLISISPEFVAIIITSSNVVSLNTFSSLTVIAAAVNLCLLFNPSERKHFGEIS